MRFWHWPARLKLRKYRIFRIDGEDYILLERTTVGRDIFVRLTPYSRYLEDRRIP